MWYAVLFGDDEIVVEFDHKPDDVELQDISQMVGYIFAGICEADSAHNAIQIALETFDGFGCVS